jgi:hypothetical protein
VKEATPTASSRKIICTLGADTSRPSGDALRHPIQAASSPTPMQTRTVQPIVRMLSVPSSSSERISRATAIVASARRASAPENSGAIQRRSQ